MLLSLALVTAVVAAARGVWSPCGLSMLSSLNPVSERARGHRFGLTAAWYVAGAVAGGAALGGGLALAAFGVGRAGARDSLTWALVLGCAAIAVASDTRMFGRSLPVHPRQVDERWLTTYRRWIYAGGYGVQIGAGFATYIMTAAVYLTAALAVLTGSPAQAFLVAVVFGAVRGLAIVGCAVANTPDRLRSLVARIDGWATPSTWVATAVAAGVAGVAAAQLGGAPAAGVTVAVLAAGVAISRRWADGVVSCPVPAQAGTRATSAAS
ncbi:hypothetical protein SAMN05443575_1589 [Jatrophihabitans endophyticus]|uniref:Cytochrome c biogenesis protein CcdA n=1 Tax=Jatrophihabitans endophyticus TaxID=1206085 RepID=A0A1M5HPB3_9ACTN|nr:hypothetical protein [Jatrophihabitans endophyticus]SHG17793.1 hypothetical protein SAMN05443575_1589 [Jatrophihabitans endophyticus]